jgi:ring-1,2-phenylacetyl-CoA epoxidase subunit PaaC
MTTPSDSIISYSLHLADNALILGHRNSEWCGHGPVLEQDIAITNISLDLVGEARNFYQYTASLINSSNKKQEKTVTEDTLAYLRDANAFKNCIIVELPKGDWAFTVLRQFLFSSYQYYLYEDLQQSKDEQISAIAVKALKELIYHLRWSSEWVIRLGDGTEESHSRMVKAAEELFSYTSEFFVPADYEIAVADLGVGIDVRDLKTKWKEKVKEIFSEATLSVPHVTTLKNEGKLSRHTEHLHQLLSEMQYMQRTYPESQW